jgi:hypothetical protein
MEILNSKGAHAAATAASQQLNAAMPASR